MIAAAVAALVTFLPIAPATAQFDGVVAEREYIKAHTEWSWSQMAWARIPECYTLKLDSGKMLTDWVCVTPDVYSATSWNDHYSGPGTAYEGSVFL